MFFVKKEMLLLNKKTIFWWCFLVLRHHCWFAFQGRIQDFSWGGGRDAPLRNGAVTDWSRDVPNYHFYGVSLKFFTLVSCFTSTPINHILFFFARIILGGGRCALLAPSLRQDPPPLLFLYGYCLVSYQTFALRHFLIWPVRNTRKVPFLANLLLFRTSGPKRHPVKEICEHLSLLLDWTRLYFKLEPRPPFRVQKIHFLYN